MRILITGATGFAAGHLIDALLQRGTGELVGTSRGAAGGWRNLPQVDWHSVDLCDSAGVLALLNKVQPDQIYHLAGYANTGKSFEEPDAAWAGNLSATRNLFEAIHRWGGRPRIVSVSSGLIYGDGETPGQALDENQPLRPVSPYAASKAAADIASYQYSRFPGLDIVRARPFNHIGPRQAPHYAVAHFARQIAAIERRQQPPILETGNLSPRRDLTDVRDVVQAYIALMEKGRVGEAYNVASGTALSMQEVLDCLLRFASVPIQVRQQPRLTRAVESMGVRGNAAKLRNETCWSPRFALERTLGDILDYWRGQAGSEAA